MGVRIIVADNHVLLREGIRSLLEKRRDFDIVGEADDGLVAVQLTKQLKPDVIIMQIAMPNLNGIEATRQVLSEKPNTKIIGLSNQFDKKYLTEMLNAGATGYLHVSCSSNELIQAILTVMSDKCYISDRTFNITVKSVKEYLASEGFGHILSTLTPKEKQILQLIAEGKSSKEIAHQQCLSVKTIEKHRFHIMGKLKAHNVAELTRFAFEEGITSLEHKTFR